MAKAKQEISVGGKNTGKITQSDEGASLTVESAEKTAKDIQLPPEVNMSGALDPAKHADLVAEAAEPEGVVLSQEGPQVAPYITGKTIMEKPNPSLPLAERFKHLSESELQMVAQANSWDNEFTLTVLENRRRETSEVDHAPYCPSEVEIVVDKGHTI